MNNCYHQECIEQVALVRVCNSNRKICNSNRKIIELYRYRILGHMLSNNGLCLCSMRNTCYYF